MVFSLTLSSIISLTDFMGFAMTAYASVSTSLSSVERILEISNPDPKDVEAPQTSNKPKEEWPTTSLIEAKNIRMRYREDLPRVLDNLSFTI